MLRNLPGFVPVSHWGWDWVSSWIDIWLLTRTNPPLPEKSDLINLLFLEEGKRLLEWLGDITWILFISYVLK